MPPYPHSFCPLSSTEFVEPPPQKKNSWVRHWTLVRTKPWGWVWLFNKCTRWVFLKHLINLCCPFDDSSFNGTLEVQVHTVPLAVTHNKTLHYNQASFTDTSAVLWDAMSCRVVQVYGHFTGSRSLTCHIPQDSNQYGHSSKTLKCHTASYSFEWPLRIGGPR